jgi:hypothetical protein
LLEESRALLINTGVRIHEAEVLGQLQTLLPASCELSIFLTRSFCLDTVGNLAAICRHFAVKTVIQGGPSDLMAAFDMEGGAQSTGLREPPPTRRPGEAISLGANRSVEIMNPALRTLATFWAYDGATGTLFTSDAFGYRMSPDAKPDPANPIDASDLDAISAFHLAKFWWLERSYTEPILRNIETMFAGRSIERIAPDHGIVIEGAGAVERTYDLMTSALKRMEASWTSVAV